MAYRVVELIRAQFPATAQVFIETVSGANETDESNEAMVMMVAGGEIIAHGLDCGVTAVNHVSKAAAVNGIVDAHAGRGGSALADNCCASTVLALLTADAPQTLWPAGVTSGRFWLTAKSSSSKTRAAVTPARRRACISTHRGAHPISAQFGPRAREGKRPRRAETRPGCGKARGLDARPEARRRRARQGLHR